MEANTKNAKDRIILGIKVIIVALAVLILYILVFGNHETNSKNWNEYATADVTFANGQQKHFDSTYMETLNTGDHAVIHVALPKDKKTNDSMLHFWLYNAVVDAYSGDRLVYSYGHEIEAKGDMIGGVYAYVPIPDGAWGGELRIVIDVTEDNAFTKISSLTVLTGEKCMREFIWQNMINFVLSITGVTFGALLIATLFLIKIERRMRWSGISLSFFILLSSIWIFSNSGMYQIISTDYFWVPLEYIALYFMPMPLVLHLLFLEKSKPIKQGMIILSCLTGIFNTVCTILNGANIVHFCNTLTYGHIVILINVLAILFMAIKGVISKDKSARNLLFGIGFMMVVAVFDIFRFYIIRIIPGIAINDLPSTIFFGLGVLIVCLVVSFSRSISEAGAKAIYLEKDLHQLRHIVSTIPSAICVYKQDERSKKPNMIDENDALWKLIGQEKKGTDILQYIPDENITILSKGIAQQLKDKKKTNQFEMVLNKPSGENVNLLILTHIDMEDSNMITINAFDITQQKELEETLRVGQQNYQLVLSQAGKAFAPLDFNSRTLIVMPELEEKYHIPHIIKLPQDIHNLDIFDETNEKKIQDFIQRVLGGSPSESLHVLCHLPGNPNVKRWFQFSCSTVFDSIGNPFSAILTFEDVHKEYLAEIDGKWKHQSIAALSESKYITIDFNLTTGVRLHSDGHLLLHIDNNANYEETHAYIANNYIITEDCERYQLFVKNSRLIECYNSGIFEDTMDFQIIGKNGTHIWVSMTVQIISEPYTNNILAQFIYKNIQEQKSVHAKLEQDIHQLETELEDSRIKILVNQMQPHFLYNALSAIRAITKVNPSYAYDLLYDFTVHLRSSIRALSSDALIPFSSELENIKAYLNIEKMRFGDKLNIEYDIKADQFMVVPLSIQPIAENAVRHGIYQKGNEGGTVRIVTEETVSAYIVTISDDGIGFDVQETLERDSDSIGLKNMIFRVRTLVKGEVSIDSTIGEGTIVTVTIPKPLKEEQQ